MSDEKTPPLIDEIKSKLPSAFSKENPEQTISRASFGLGVGAFVGFLLGGGTGAGLGAAAGLTLAAMSAPDAPKGVLTPERKRFYEKAMSGIESPEELAKIAEAFDAEELHAHAELLRKKAELRKLSPEAAKSRGQVFLKGLATSSPDTAETLAANYQAEGALVAAKALRRHAQELRATQKGDRSDKLVESFEQKLTLVGEMFGPETKQMLSAEKNLAVARGQAASPPAAAPAAPPTEPVVTPPPEPAQPAAPPPQEPPPSPEPPQPPAGV